MMAPHLTQQFFGRNGELKIKRINRAKRVARREKSLGRLIQSAHDKRKGPYVGPRANFGVSEKREKSLVPTGNRTMIPRSFKS